MDKLMKVIFKPTVPVINIYGIISPKTVIELEQNLKSIRHSTARAIAVVINSPGGSSTQSQKIASILHNYAEQHHLPVYTFAEDQALSAAYQILISSGKKSFCASQSLIGSVGVVSKHLSFKQLAENYGIEIRKVTSDEKSLSNMGYLQDIQESHKQQLQNIAEIQHQQLIQLIEKARGYQIKVPENQRQQKIYNGEVFNGQEAVQLGLVDQVGQVQDVMKKDFPKANLVYYGSVKEGARNNLYFKLLSVFSNFKSTSF